MEMKQLKRCLFVSYLLFAHVSVSQNLIQNPGFEDYDSCPSINMPNPIQYVPFWNSSMGTSYCNRCSNDRFSVPNNLYVNSYQETNSGNGYVIFENLNWYFSNFRIYISNELNTSGLSQSTCYYVEFFVSLVNNIRYGTNNLAMHFSSTENLLIRDGYSYLLDAKPHIKKFGNPIISDTMNWVKISGIYQAQGGEKYITIGNFNTDEETDTLALVPGEYPASWYYLDDVSVIPINSENMPANAGADVLVNPGDSVFIGQEISNLNCRWFNLTTGEQIADSISGIWVSPAETTSYVVRQDLCGSITYDTVRVTVGFAGINTLNVSKNSIKVVPNPSTNNLTIYYKDVVNFNVKIIDIQGREQTFESFAKNNNVLIINHTLKRGFYTIVLDDNGKIQSQKISVE
jgi:hypothetical protein